VEGAGAGGGGSESQQKVDGGVRILGDPNFSTGSATYPAVEEIDALRRKTIPPGLRYFYNVACRDTVEDADAAPVCKDHDPAEATLLFWRSMTADDIANYARRMTTYNRRFVTKGGQPNPVAVPRELRLANHLAGGTWPEDFMIMTGTIDKDYACGDQFVAFSYWPREFMLDVAIIENLSQAPISVSDLLGGRASDTRLRVATSQPALANSKQPLGIAVGTLSPAERALVPLKIHLGLNQWSTKEFPYRQTASAVHRQRGAGGYGGNTAGFGAPSFRAYAWGPEIVIGGLVVDGARIDLTNRSANYLEMTMSTESGSCPYLLSQAEDGDWVDHGKVLHKAPSREREYSEERSFPGFRSRFRIEEREPEIAFLDQAELIVTFKDGSTRTLSSDNPHLAARDGEYLRLVWGDTVDINFVLPQGIAEGDVVESRFTVTGYYLRYSDRMAEEGADTPASSRANLNRGAMSTPVPADASRASAATCPVPATLVPLVAGAL